MSNDPENTLRVYICSAQTDASFATDLMTGLIACGFDARAGHENSNRPPAPTALSKTEQLDRITNSDTIVFVLSPEALNDQVAISQLEHAYNLGKRIFLTPIRQISSAEAPEAMLKMPFVSFHGNSSFAVALSHLATKLKTDSAWVTKHTHISKMAQKWSDHNRSRTLLVFGKELEKTILWANNTPTNAARITKTMEAFLLASQEAFKDTTIRKNRAGPSKLSLFAITGLLALAVFNGIKWREATSLTQDLTNQIDVVSIDNAQLEAVQTRLYSDIRLAPHSVENNFLGDIQGWYPRAASYAGSVGRIAFPEIDPTTGQTKKVTGLIISGELLNPSFQERSFLLTPTFNRSIEPKLIAASSPNDPTSATLEKINIQVASQTSNERVMLTVVEPASNDKYDMDLSALHGDLHVFARGAVWHSQIKNEDKPAFSLHEVVSEIPQGARAISLADLDCRRFSRMTTLGQELSEFDVRHFDPIGTFSLAPSFTGQEATENARGTQRSYATLQISKMSSDQTSSFVSYEASQILPETGAPVFNLTTGKIIALHIGQSATNKDIFEGVSLVSLLNEVRADLSVPTSNLNSVCETY